MYRFSFSLKNPSKCCIDVGVTKYAQYYAHIAVHLRVITTGKHNVTLEIFFLCFIWFTKLWCQFSFYDNTLLKKDFEFLNLVHGSVNWLLDYRPCLLLNYLFY